MIISEDHILQEELNNVTRILLASNYILPLRVSKKPSSTAAVSYYSTDTTYINKYSSHHHSHLNIGKSFIATIHKNWKTVVDNATLSAIWPPSAYSKSSSIYNYLVHSTQTYGSLQDNSLHS